MTLDYSIHKNILLRLLKDVYSDTAVGANLGFKGGTAAHLFYELPRYSVDLDFDLLDPAKEAFVFEAVRRIAAEYGTLIEAREKRFCLLFVLSYQREAQNVKIEIDRRQFGSSYEKKTLLGIPMLVMVRADMFAHKLMAMYERIEKTSRDVFDVHYFAKQNWPMNRELVESRSGKSYETVLAECIEMLEHKDSKRILDGLGELRSDAAKDRARATLKEDTLFLLRLMYEQA